MPKISVIVPVYNTEKYLHRCIDSILAQTYTDFELLLIDDGSADSSGAICDEYAQKDSRVRVFHKANGGVSSARNLGLDNAQGEWITFVDADDWVEAKFLEILFVYEGFDFATCYYNAIGWKEWIASPPQDQLYYTHDIKNCISHNILSWNTPWCKMYKNEIVKKNNCRFNVRINLGEDTLFVYQYLKYVSSIRISSEALYNYNSLPILSLSKKKKTWDEVSISLNLILDSIEELECIYKINLQDCKDYFMRFFVKKSFANCSSYRDVFTVVRYMHDDKNVSSLVLRHNLLRNKMKIVEMLFNKHIDWLFALVIYLKFCFKKLK